MNIFYIFFIIYEIVGFIGSLYLLGANTFNDKWSMKYFKKNFLTGNFLDWLLWLFMATTFMPILMLFWLRSKIYIVLGRNQYTGRKITKRSKLE